MKNELTRVPLREWSHTQSRGLGRVPQGSRDDLSEPFWLSHGRRQREGLSNRILLQTFETKYSHKD